MALTREQILAASPRTVVTVPIAGMGDVCMCALTGAEVSTVRVAVNMEDPAAYTQALATVTLCDESGARLFTPADAGAVFDKPFGIGNALITQALTINGMNVEAADDQRKP